MRTHQPRRRFGQNFLKNKDILKTITQSLQLSPAQPVHILEIGPGQGALTDYLLAAGATVYAIEIDRDLIAYLSEKYASYTDRCFLYEHDVLQVDLQDFIREHHISHVIGNLPYNISTPFLLKYAKECSECPGSFLIQREVANRLRAVCGTKDYGRLSLALQHGFHVTKVCDVGPENFHPAPQVQSQVVQLTPKPSSEILQRSQTFQAIVDTAFQQRRKILKNALSQWEIDFVALNIDPLRRPETLSEYEFNHMASHATPKPAE